MDINQLIAKYGPALSRDLHVAGTQLYDKLLWYTRIDGLIELARIFVAIVVAALYLRIAIKYAARQKREEGDGDALFVIGFIIPTLGAFVVGAAYGCAYFLTDALVKICVPDYWIIQQAVNAVSGK